MSHRPTIYGTRHAVSAGHSLAAADPRRPAYAITI